MIRFFEFSWSKNKGSLLLPNLGVTVTPVTHQLGGTEKYYCCQNRWQEHLRSVTPNVEPKHLGQLGHLSRCELQQSWKRKP